MSEIKPIYDCLICGKPVPEYIPEYCCDGTECCCQGMPPNPCCCSKECYDALFKYIGYEYDKRRELAGIKKWNTRKAGE